MKKGIFLFCEMGGFGFLNFSRKNILQKLQRSLDTFGLFGGIWFGRAVVEEERRVGIDWKASS